jgi:hypothetical protein
MSPLLLPDKKSCLPLVGCNRDRIDLDRGIKELL